MSEHRINSRSGTHGVGVGRCRCSRQVSEDGKGCEWHTAVQAEVLREVADAVNATTGLLSTLRLRRRIASILTTRRD